MAQVTTYSATLGAHEVQLQFDQKLVVLNRARLLIDGEELDSTRVVYGERELATTLDDDTEVLIRLHSGMNGELTRAQLRRDDGSWEDLTE